MPFCTRTAWLLVTLVLLVAPGSGARKATRTLQDILSLYDSTTSPGTSTEPHDPKVEAQALPRFQQVRTEAHSGKKAKVHTQATSSHSKSKSSKNLPRNDHLPAPQKGLTDETVSAELVKHMKADLEQTGKALAAMAKEQAQFALPANMDLQLPPDTLRPHADIATPSIDAVGLPRLPGVPDHAAELAPGASPSAPGPATGDLVPPTGAVAAAKAFLEPPPTAESLKLELPPLVTGLASDPSAAATDGTDGPGGILARLGLEPAPPVPTTGAGVGAAAARLSVSDALDLPPSAAAMGANPGLPSLDDETLPVLPGMENGGQVRLDLLPGLDAAPPGAGSGAAAEGGSGAGTPAAEAPSSLTQLRSRGSNHPQSLLGPQGELAQLLTAQIAGAGVPGGLPAGLDRPGLVSANADPLLDLNPQGLHQYLSPDPSLSADAQQQQLDDNIKRLRDALLQRMKHRTPDIEELQRMVEAEESKVIAYERSLSQYIDRIREQGAKQVQLRQDRVDKIKAELDKITGDQKADATNVNMFNSQLRQSVYLARIKQQKDQLASLTEAQKSLQSDMAETTKRLQATQKILGINGTSTDKPAGDAAAAPAEG